MERIAETMNRQWAIYRHDTVLDDGRNHTVYIHLVSLHPALPPVTYRRVRRLNVPEQTIDQIVTRMVARANRCRDGADYDFGTGIVGKDPSLLAEYRNGVYTVKDRA